MRVNDYLIFDIAHEGELKHQLDFEKNFNLVILYSLEESLDWLDFFHRSLDSKLKLVENINFKLVVNDTCTLESYKGIELIKIPAFLLKTVYRIENGQDVNKNWNHLSNQALILTGKTNSPNRIGFLIECIKAGILKNHIYSFFPPKEPLIKHQTLNIFNELCDWDYDSFCKEYENNPDDIDIRNTEEDMHYSGFPFSTKLFSDTVVSVVLETNIYRNHNNNADFSEKTYKAIINKHPFIIANSPNSLTMLKKYGFYTFEEYMLNSNYDSISDPFEKNKKIVENLNYFLETYHKSKDKINHRVEHNYNRMIQIYNQFKIEHPDIHLCLSDYFFTR